MTLYETMFTGIKTESLSQSNCFVPAMNIVPLLKGQTESSQDLLWEQFSFFVMSTGRTFVYTTSLII